LVYIRHISKSHRFKPVAFLSIRLPYRTSITISKDSETPLPDTVTVVVCLPAGRLSLGRNMNSISSPATMFGITNAVPFTVHKDLKTELWARFTRGEGQLISVNSKLFAFPPENLTARMPDEALPVFRIVVISELVSSPTDRGENVNTPL